MNGQQYRRKLGRGMLPVALSVKKANQSKVENKRREIVFPTFAFMQEQCFVFRCDLTRIFWKHAAVDINGTADSDVEEADDALFSIYCTSNFTFPEGTV